MAEHITNLPVAKRNPQKATLLLGVVVFAIMGIFPPWRASDDGGRTYRPAGYGFIGASPVGRKERQDQLQREVDALVAKRSPPPVQAPRRKENYAILPDSGFPTSLEHAERLYQERLRERDEKVLPATTEEIRLRREIEVLNWHGMHIDLVRLSLQWAVLAVIVGTGLVLTKPTHQAQLNKGREGTEPEPNETKPVPVAAAASGRDTEFPFHLEKKGISLEVKMTGAVIFSLIGYAVLGFVLPLTAGGNFLKMVGVIALGVGVLRWAKSGTQASLDYQAEIIWTILFLLDGGLGILPGVVYGGRSTWGLSPAFFAFSWVLLGVVLAVVAVVVSRLNHSSNPLPAEPSATNPQSEVLSTLGVSPVPRAAPQPVTTPWRLALVVYVTVALGFPLAGLLFFSTTRPGAPGYGKNSTNIEKELGLVMKEIPAGKFLMGSPKGEVDRSDNELQHEVEITKPFLMSAHAVTRGQFARFVKDAKYDAGSGWQNPGFAQEDNHPVVCVSWNDAAAFCQWLSKESGKTYDLPTEAEWEYACRAGSTGPFHYGYSLSSKQANFNGKFPYGGAAEGPYLARTTRVGSYQPNAFGLYDMHGNVWQWCKDWYTARYDRVGPSRDPQGPTTGTYRMLRGGSWVNDARICRSACCFNVVLPVDRNFDVGFRVVVRFP